MQALREIKSELVRLKWHVAASRFQVALRRHALALKAGFNADQPRVPAGNSDGGQWTSGGQSSSEGSTTDFSGARRGPGIGHNQGPPINDPSDIPPNRPNSAQERNRIAQAISRNATLVAFFLTVIATAAHHWLVEKYWEIKADQDPAKELGELQDAVLRSDKRGYDVHHIVEKASALDYGFSSSLINSHDNLILIPRYKHWKLNSWYETPNADYGGLTPRKYLQDKSWAERRRLGLDGLREVGVLKS